MIVLHGCGGLIRCPRWAAGVALCLALHHGESRAAGIAHQATTTGGPIGGAAGALAPGSEGLTPASLAPQMPALITGSPPASPSMPTGIDWGTGPDGRPIIGWIEGAPIRIPPPSPGDFNEIWPIGFYLIPVYGPSDGGTSPGGRGPISPTLPPPVLPPSAAETVTTPEPSAILSALAMVGFAAFSRRRDRRSA